MRNFIRILALLFCVSIMMPALAATASDGATPEEVVAKVKEAAAYVAAHGDSALPEFNEPGGKWAWKDTYVFVYTCDDMLIRAHPSAKLINLDPEKIKDAKGTFISLDLCAAVDGSESGWAEYYWPKAGEEKPSRKVTYMHKVPGTPYSVGAGIYDDTITAEELNAKMK